MENLDVDISVEDRLLELLAEQNRLLWQLANGRKSILRHTPVPTPAQTIHQTPSVKPRLSLVPKTATPAPGSIYDQIKNDSRFKAFARRRSTIPVPTIAELLKTRRKAQASVFRAFCKPLGIWSILKDGPYWTGRLTEDGPETLKIAKVCDEWISQDPWESKTVSQLQEAPCSVNDVE